MTAQEAFDNLDPQGWAQQPPHVRLHLLEEVRDRMRLFASDLAIADGDMKNELLGEDLYSYGMNLIATVVPVANTLTACIHLYENIIKGHMPSPEKITQISDQIYDVEVKPLDAKDRLMSATQKMHLRIKGEPKQINPLEKPAGIIAVSGAGNYSSSLEMVKAMFLENKAVIHKPHQLNAKTDEVWEKIFEPLIEAKAIAFIDHAEGKAMTTLEGLDKIYFTGSTAVAKAIDAASSTPLISECGGNNPCIIVPGDQPWSKKEIEHQAIQIATISKLNGGAVCGRVQTLVTSKHWPQREEFLDALERAIEDQTPAAGTYYPGSDKVLEKFMSYYPDAKVLKPEGGKYKNANFVVIRDIDQDSFAVQNEAFCQIIDEVALDLPANASEFLPHAVEFCNTKLLGTLGSCILIDEKTKKHHKPAVDQAVTDMEYGAVTVNTMPPFVFLSPYLTWGGNEEGKEFVSGIGNFGNTYCFENIEKSILEDQFMSMGHMMNTNKKAFDHLGTNMAEFSMHPSWGKLTKMLGTTAVDNFRKKDF
ncbi:aldehyde dehydrogenase family protein [Flammeovirga aprica]|uniref:Aldehyde dehydrogenase family protein n=1 Tax=Flammeovirga aprica JL-4 TaxID=694437 RepID=A0A7X9S107_9BACT|nr:aldehyde dehydrogenase family protein [Flammeovirga aprica]NME72383.1 aldehyde dehydrogenase family protein [Flammeovirga aprica JL-4]